MDAHRRITFLYKLMPGVAEASFGLNVARLAQMPEAVVQRAAAKAAEWSATQDRWPVGTGTQGIR